MTNVNQPDLRDTMISVAACLDGWTWEPHRNPECIWSGALVHVDGARVRVSIDRSYVNRKAPRFTARGDWPKRKDSGHAVDLARDWGVIDYGEKEPEISFSASKCPEAMAKDLERRLFPRILPLYAKALARKAESDALDAKEGTILSELAALSGGSVSRDGKEVVLRRGEMHGSVKCHARDGQVSIDFLWLDLATARKILAIIAKP